MQLWSLKTKWLFTATLIYVSIESRSHLKGALGRKTKLFLSETHEFAMVSCKGTQNKPDLFLWPWGIQTEVAVTPYHPQITGETHLSLPELQISSGWAFPCPFFSHGHQVPLGSLGCNLYSESFWGAHFKQQVEFSISQMWERGVTDPEVPNSWLLPDFVSDIIVMRQRSFQFLDFNFSSRWLQK